MVFSSTDNPVILIQLPNGDSPGLKNKKNDTGNKQEKPVGNRYHDCTVFIPKERT